MKQSKRKIGHQTIAIVLLLSCSLYPAVGQEDKVSKVNLILSKIKANPGDGSNVIAILRAVKPSYIAEGKILDMKNYPKEEVKKVEYSESDDYRIVARSTAIMKGPAPGSGLLFVGEFFLDKALNVLADGIWDGKKNGANHTIIGSVKLYDYLFESDKTDPLQFTITKKGYIYHGGKGNVKDLQSGQEWRLPSQDISAKRQATEAKAPKGTAKLPLGIEITFSEWTQKNRTHKELSELREAILQPVKQANLGLNEKLRLLITYEEDGWVQIGRASGVDWELTYMLMDDKQKEQMRKKYNGTVESEVAKLVENKGGISRVSLGVSVGFQEVKADVVGKLREVPPFPVKMRIRAQKTAPAKVESEEQEPTVKLALKFNLEDSTTYKVTTDNDNSVIWESADPNKPKGFTGRHTGRKIEITFTQQIQSTDDKGNAVAKITIKQLKYLAKVKDEITMDFDSSRQEDRQNPLSNIIGQSYAIEITASGEVSKLIDANDARAAVMGDSSADKTATSLLSLNAITQRHMIPALPAADKNQLRTGENWSSIKSFSFTMMGSKAYEKIYTLKEIKDVDNRRIAIALMEAVPSAEYAKELHKEQSASFFANMSDNTETYTGQLKLDLTGGKVEEYRENLTSEWFIVDPNPKDSEQPAALKMTAVRSYSIEQTD